MANTQPFVELKLLDGGSFIAEERLLHAGAKDNSFRLYDFSFYLYHPNSGRRLLWDVGLSNDATKYPPAISNGMFPHIRAVGPRRSIQEQLVQDHGVKVSDIDAVIFSHAHWDHCRPISEEFPGVKAYFGPGTREACTPGHYIDTGSQWDGRFFDPEKYTEQWEELQGQWIEFGSFDKALDYFGDGSFWIIQAPGHMAGNLCAAARVHGNEWVLLGGDCCHTRELYLGDQEFAVFDLPNGDKSCLQEDISAAKTTLTRMRAFEMSHSAHVALAHDTTWMQEARDQTLMSLLSQNLRAALRNALPSGEVL